MGFRQDAGTASKLRTGGGRAHRGAHRGGVGMAGWGNQGIPRWALKRHRGAPEEGRVGRAKELRL